MTDDPATTSPTERPIGFFSFVTSDESLARGQLNFWAISETIAAIIAFWWVALKWETWTIFYPSLVAAPLLLLRSEKSVKLGVRCFENRLAGRVLSDDLLSGQAAESRPVTRAAWTNGAVSFAVGFVVAWYFFRRFLVDLDGLTRLLHDIEVGSTSSAAEVAAAVAVSLVAAIAVPILITEIAVVSGTAAFIGAGAGAGVLTGVIVGVITVVFTGWEQIAGAIAIALVGAGAGAIAGALGRRRIRARMEAAIVLIFLPLSLAILMSVGAGILAVALVVRVAATMRHLPSGFSALPANLRRICLTTSPFHLPELIPGLASDSEYRLGILLRAIRKKAQSSSIYDKIYATLFLFIFPIWYLPGVLYRFALKSTMWLWWILAFVGGDPGIDRGVEGILTDHIRKLNAKISIAFAAAGLTAFIVPNMLLPALGYAATHPPIPPMVVLFAATDLNNIALLPLVGAVVAVMAIGFVFWIDAIKKDEEIGRDVSTNLAWFGHIAKIKRGLGWAMIAATMLYVGLYWNAQHGWLPVSEFAYAKLEWVYGKYAVALMPQPR